MLKVLITDDQPIIRLGVRQILLEAFSFVQLVEAQDHKELLTRAKEVSWDIFMIDPDMPGMLEAIKQVLLQWPSAPVLLLSTKPDSLCTKRAIQLGSTGYLGKDAGAPELVTAVKQLLAGKKYIPDELLANAGQYNKGLLPHQQLSERELDVFKLLVTGKTIAAIGRILSLQPNTVSTYRSRLLSKMNLRNNAELLRYALEHGLV